jgi:hypothetical protein
MRVDWSPIRTGRRVKRKEYEWSHPPGLNRRPADYESAALPTELGWPDAIDYGETVPGLLGGDSLAFVQ